MYTFQNENEHTMNWVDIESRAHELASANDSNVWMEKFTDADTPLSTQPITDCTNVESYNINNEYFVSSESGASTIPDSNESIAQDHILPLQEYHSLLRKMNKEQRHIFDDVMYAKKQRPEEPIRLFITGGAGTGKTFTLMLLIQALLRFYNRHPDSDPFKKKALLMAYTGKATYNIDGATIHSSLSLPLNCKNLPSLSSERLDTLVKKYDQLQLLVLDEISLIGKKILKFTDLRLRSIKRLHTSFFVNLDVIITGDFFQVQPVRDSGVFKNTNESMDDLAEDFWLNKIKCYELNQVMRQSDQQFIDILNRFRTATQTQNDIDIVNSQCVRNPPRDPKFPHLFYKNEPRLQHNESVFQRTEGSVYVLYKKNKHQ